MVESAAVPAPVDNRPSLIRRRLYIQEYLQFRYALLFVLLPAVGAVTGHVLPQLDTLLGSNLWPFRVFSLVLILFIIVEIIFLSLSFTHKNVGPIYNLRMYLEKAVEEKNLTGRVQFRQTDELNESTTSWMTNQRENMFTQATDSLGALATETSKEKASGEVLSFGEKLAEGQSLLNEALLSYKTCNE